MAFLSIGHSPPKSNKQCLLNRKELLEKHTIFIESISYNHTYPVKCCINFPQASRIPSGFFPCDLSCSTALQASGMQHALYVLIHALWSRLGQCIKDESGCRGWRHNSSYSWHHIERKNLQAFCQHGPRRSTMNTLRPQTQEPMTVSLERVCFQRHGHLTASTRRWFIFWKDNLRGWALLVHGHETFWEAGDSYILDQTYKPEDASSSLWLISPFYTRESAFGKFISSRQEFKCYVKACSCAELFLKLIFSTLSSDNMLAKIKELCSNWQAYSDFTSFSQGLLPEITDSNSFCQELELYRCQNKLPCMWLCLISLQGSKLCSVWI